MTGTIGRAGLRGWRRALAACLVITVLAPLFAMSPPGAGAVGINVYYDDTIESAVDPCTLENSPACPDGVDRSPELEFLAQVAAAYWSVIFHDAHNLTIRVGWVTGEAPFARVLQVDGQGRPLLADLLITADIAWYWDQTPFDDDEFAMFPKLYRDAHPAEQAEAFNGAPPEILEVGFNGVGPAPDLLTVLLHEIGHVIGLNGKTISNRPIVPCTEDVETGDPYYHVDPSLVGGATMSIKAFEQKGEFPITLARSEPSGDSRQLAGLDKPTLFYDCAHLAAGGIKECGDDSACKAYQALMWPGMLPGARSRPSVTDILAIATAAGWTEVHLPRKYSLGSGLWLDGDTWLGGRLPNAGNNVYIVNQSDEAVVTLFEDGQAREVLVSDGNKLNVTFGKLDAFSLEATGQGTAVTVDSGALLDTVYVDLLQGTLLDIAGAGVKVFWTLTNQGTIRGGNAVIELHTLNNKGEIRSNGGPLTIIARPNGGLDLDGDNEFPQNRVLRATTGDLTFDGQITDEVSAAVIVGAGYTMTFTEGWTQQYTGNPATAVQLLGSGAEATISGESALNGYVEVSGLGRFTSDTTFGPWSRLAISLGGPTPGAEHDQINFDQQAAFNGTLDLTLQPGFTPAPNDSFVIAQYGSHSGAFSDVTGWDLGDYLRLELEYDDDELRVVARLAGDMNGDGKWTNQDKPLLAQSFGPCPADPIPCTGDLNGDGVIDHDDLKILNDLIKAQRKN